MTTTEERRRAPAPPPRVSAPAPAVDNSKLLYGNADPAKAQAFWDKLAWNNAALDQSNFAGERPADGSRDGPQGHADAASLQRWEAQGPTNAIAGNFNNGSSAYGSIGSQGGIQPVQGKPGYYEVVRQPAGNKSYNLVKAEYKVGADGKTMERTGEWTPLSFDSETKWGQTTAKVFGSIAGAAAAGLGGATAGGEVGGAATGTGEGLGAVGGEGLGATGGAVDAGGMGIGQIGASQLTPALAESAVGSSGYGLSSAGLGYMGPAAGAGGVAPFNTNATNPALIESASGTPGYGASSAGAGGGAGASGLSPQQWKQLGDQASKFGDRSNDSGGGGGGAGGGGITGVDLAALAALEAQEQANLQRIAQSSRKVKTPASNAGLSMMRGTSGEDPISANGVHVAAAQELIKQVTSLQQRVKALKAGKRKGN